MVHHQLLCLILSKYGFPASLVETIRKLYNDCKVKIQVGKKVVEIDYTTGVHQGDNMSPVLFLFVMHAFLQTLQLKSQPVHFAYFPDNKNGNLNSQKGRLLGQSSKAKGMPFSFSSSFYIDDSFLLFQSKEHLHQAIIELDKRFARFSLIMQIGSSKTKSKPEAMFFPTSLKQAKEEFDQNILPDKLLLPNDKNVHFVNKFKYLGSIITPMLNEDVEIEARISKAKSLMGAAKYFFDNKDIDK